MTEASHGRIIDATLLSSLAVAGEDIATVREQAIAAERAVSNREIRWHMYCEKAIDSLVQNPNITVSELAAGLSALQAAEIGELTEVIEARAERLAQLYEKADAALSFPGELVLSMAHFSDIVLYKTNGEGVVMELKATGEGYRVDLGIGTVDADGRDHRSPVVDEKLQNVVVDPELAAQIPSMHYPEKSTPRLIVGSEAILAFMLAEGSSGLPFRTWKEARKLGFRFEEMDSTLKEKYDEERQRLISNLASSLNRGPQISGLALASTRWREDFKEIEYYGGTKDDVRAALASEFVEHQKKALGLLDVATQTETQEPSPVDDRFDVPSFLRE